MGLIISILANSIGLYIASSIVPGVVVSDGVSWYYFALAGIMFTIVFSIILPIIKTISFPIIFLTLGLFSFILNLLAFYTLDLFLTQLEFTSLLSIILTSIIISSINMISNSFLR